MSNLYVLDETLDFLNESKIDRFAFIYESISNELNEFNTIVESLVLNEKVDFKEILSKAWNKVKEFFKKIIDSVKSFAGKIKSFLLSIKDRIVPTYYDEWDDDWDDFELDWDDEFFDEAVSSETVVNMIKSHMYISLPMLTKAINLNNFSKVERYLNDVEINKRANTNDAVHGNVAIEKSEDGGTKIGAYICSGKVKTIIFDSTDKDIDYLLHKGDTVTECINNYCKDKYWIKAHNLNTTKNLYTYCRELLKYGETKALVDYLNKMTGYLERLNKIIDTKFGMISKMIADHNEEKYKDADKMPTTLLQAFRHTAEYLNSDISTLNVLINASIQKTKDAAYICGYIEAKNKTNEE